MSALTATFWTIFGAYMFLPMKVSYVLPLIPNIDKQNVAAYCALFGCLVIKKIKFRFVAGAPGARLLVLIGLSVSTFTVLTNSEPVFTGMTVKPGLSPKDIISMTFQMTFAFTPFVLGALLIKSIDDGIKVLRLIAIAGLIYSPFLVIEVLLSPQLHTWVYGFFPHSFGQQIRFGGFRPVVFMGHGLVVANFSVAVLIAIAGLWKAKQKIFIFPNIVLVFYALFLLLICKSVGAWLLGFLGFAILLFLPIRLATLTAFSLASAVFLYPLLSIANLIPHDALLDLAAKFGPDKVGSLAFRFEHEEALLAHGQEKLLFGWGGWDRNRIDGAVTDGFWIIKFTQFGLLGYLVFLGLPMLAVKNLRKAVNSSRNDIEARIYCVFALLIALIMVDQIPNASQQNWVYFLYGVATGLVASRRNEMDMKRKRSANNTLACASNYDRRSNKGFVQVNGESNV
ncbi:hypothetical protein JF535_01245 [Microbulbifer salipaludis]|uniref:O-antigen ligase-like membrane protein n=1 Tax=Microbulbifer salipaludis TaxID=187980 RepID=A0ABS3E2V6_9GAMM|nr:hypothetical protein [Microbulbifer salipaludis]MBN8429464.1 hypothetical protein [Microbulbifer salipaludis]